MFSQAVWIRFAERFLAWFAIVPAVATVQVGTLDKAYFAGLIVRRVTVLFNEPCHCPTLGTTQGLLQCHSS